MKIKLFIVLSFLALASCKSPSQKVVVTGDSWASFVCAFKSLDKAMAKVGIVDTATNDTCPVTTQLGAQAKNWLSDSFHKATRVALMEKSVKVLYLSLGGNDFLSNWNKNLLPAEESELFEKITNDIGAVVADYKAARPDVKIIISAYDFPRFTLNHPIDNYSEMFDKMGQPTPLEINSAILRFSETVSTLADNTQVFYIQHYGLMHYYYGNTESNLEPYKTLRPEVISPPDGINKSGGSVGIPSDPKALLQVGDVGTITDAFHLSRAGFELLADHTVMHYLKNWLKP